MYQERLSMLYILTGASLLFTVVVIFHGFKNYEYNFIPTNIPSIHSQPQPLPYQYSASDNKQEKYSKPQMLKSAKSQELLTPKEYSGPKPGYKDPRVERIIRRERQNISRVMEGFNFQYGGGLKDYTLETAGTPVRALVVTTWRSGSTFLGDIMNSHPATYYHYEPLLHFDIRQARSGHLGEEAQRTLTSLMKCDYSELDRYLQYGKSHNYLFTHNERLWHFCDSGKNAFCWQPYFLNRFCSLFPFQSIKTVRLRLNLTRIFMDDESNKVKVLLLVRDPRGTMESRRHRDWCPGNPDCEDPAKLCGDLESDYYAYQQLVKQYPERYKVFRYEDFSMNPYNNSKEVFQFFGFTMHTNVINFLDTHTKNNIGGVSSTFRDSKTAPFKWREKLTAQDVFTIQEKCDKAMQLWGYRKLSPDQKLLDLDPVMDLEKFSIP